MQQLINFCWQETGSCQKCIFGSQDLRIVFVDNLQKQR